MALRERWDLLSHWRGQQGVNNQINKQVLQSNWRSERLYLCGTAKSMMRLRETKQAGTGKALHKFQQMPCNGAQQGKCRQRRWLRRKR